MKFVVLLSACLSVSLLAALKYGLKWNIANVFSPLILLLLFLTFGILEIGADAEIKFLVPEANVV